MRSWIFLIFTSVTCFAAPSSLEEKVSQLVMTADYGDEYQAQKDGKASVAEIRERVNRLVAENQVAGVFFQGKWTPNGLRERIRQLQNLAKRPLIMAQDMEWGLAMRHDGVVELPKQLCIGAIVDSEAVEEWASACAKEAQSLGINLILGPDADIYLYPNNPVIHDRSFGSNPEEVAKKVVTVVNALTQAGIFACVKHFPGLGRTKKDPHTSLPSLKVSYEELEKADLVPFKASIAAEVPCVMTTHIALPKTESGETAASLSPFWVKKVLRDECHFRGVAITDDLIMGATLAEKTIPTAAVEAIRAGNDLCLIGRETKESVDAIVAAVQSGALSEKEIDEHLGRVNQLKRAIRVQQVGREQCVASTIELSRRLYKQALTLVGAPLPQKMDQTLVVQVGSTPLSPFLRRLSEHIPSLQIDAIRKDPREEDVDGIIDDLRNKKEVLIVLCDLERTPATSYGLSKNLLAALQRISQSGKSIRYIIFGSPYVLSSLPQPLTSALIAYEATQEAQEAAFEALVGKVRPEGRVPVQLETPSQ